MTRVWDDTRPVYYGSTVERNAFDEVGEASGALFWDWDDGTLYVWTGSVWQAVGGGVSQDNTTRIDHTVSPYNVAAVDAVLFCDTDGGAITANLPAGVEGMHHKLANVGSSGNDLTVDPNGAEELYGAGAGVAATLADGEVIDIHYNATEGWF
jgi:hypothetical protein